MNATEIAGGLFALISSIVLGYLAYKRGSKADDAAQESAAIGQVYAGYGGLLQSIQKDNANLRRRLSIAEDHIAQLAGAEQRLAIAETRLKTAEERIVLLQSMLEGTTT